MSGENPQPERFGKTEFHNIFDRAMQRAKERGEKEPRMEDVFLASFAEPLVARVFSELGVEINLMAHDLEYAIHFHQPQADENVTNQDKQAQLSEQANYILKRLAEVKEIIYEQGNADFMRGVDAANEAIMSVITDLSVLRVDREVRLELTTRAASFFATQTAARGDMSDPEFHEQVEELVKLLSDFGRFVAGMATHKEPLTDANYVFQALLISNQGTITPHKFVNFLIDNAGSFIRYVAHRNGLVARQGYKPYYQLPSRGVIALANEVYRHAHHNGVDEIQDVHLLPVVLSMPQVRSKLGNHGVGAWEKLRSDYYPDMPIGSYRGMLNEIEDIVYERKKGRGDVFRRPTEVSAYLRALLKDLDSKTADVDEDKIPLVLLDMLTEIGRETNAGDEGYLHYRDDSGAVDLEKLRADPYLLLHSVGVSSIVLDAWPKLIEQDIKPLPLDDQDDRPDFNGRKISDHAYERAMKKHAVDLTAEAEAGHFDDLKIRDEQVDDILRILSRKKKRNVLIIGDAGAGKSALVKSVAKRIVEARNVPPRFVGSKVFDVNFGSMNEGAIYRGMFEVELSSVLDGTAERNREIQSKNGVGETILAIDEFHSAMNQGAAQNTDGAGELIKKRAEDGSLLCIGATTLEEYRRHIYPNAALRRRFQPYFFEAPDEKLCLEILEVTAASLEKHHKIKIPKEMLKLAYDLSERFIHDEGNPDKAITLLDTAAGNAAFTGLAEMQRDDLFREIAGKTGLNADFIAGKQRRRYASIGEDLAAGVIDQRQATDGVADVLKQAALGMADPGKPQGLFMFLGPSGVGKTETAKIITLHKCGTLKALMPLTMSQYDYPGSKVKLLEDIAGMVSHHPDGVLLLDEITHAHPSTYQALYQALDEGFIRRLDGQEVSLKNVLGIMTDNMGMEEAHAFIEKHNLDDNPDSPLWNEVNQIYRRAAERFFGTRSALLGRVGLENIYGFRNLSQRAAFKIVAREVGKVSRQLEESMRHTVVLEPALHTRLAEMGQDMARRSGHGGRAVEQLFRSVVKAPLADELMALCDDVTVADSYEKEGAGILTIQDIYQVERQRDGRGLDMFANTVKLRRDPRPVQVATLSAG